MRLFIAQHGFVCPHRLSNAAHTIAVGACTVAVLQWSHCCIQCVCVTADAQPCAVQSVRQRTARLARLYTLHWSCEPRPARPIARVRKQSLPHGAVAPEGDRTHFVHSVAAHCESWWPGLLCGGAAVRAQRRRGWTHWAVSCGTRVLSVSRAARVPPAGSRHGARRVASPAVRCNKAVGALV